MSVKKDPKQVFSVFIGLGSNLAQPQTQISQAITEMAQLTDTSLLKQSSLYRSTALGSEPQPDYLNAVVELATALNPHALLKALQSIEARHGRIRKQRWEPRPLDLDILLYGNQLISTETLIVPHAEMTKRHFVLYPLAEIAPDLVIPGAKNENLNQLLQRCPKSELKKIID